MAQKVKLIILKLSHVWDSYRIIVSQFIGIVALIIAFKLAFGRK